MRETLVEGVGFRRVWKTKLLGRSSKPYEVSIVEMEIEGDEEDKVPFYMVFGMSRNSQKMAFPTWKEAEEYVLYASGYGDDGYSGSCSMSVIAMIAVVVLTTACTYTHPSIATPDLVERVSNGHTICYYRDGPSRGYAKCCPECEHPTHKQTITQGEAR